MSKYHADSLLTAAEVAEVSGYAPSHITSLIEPGNSHYDPLLRRLQVDTDETWRKAFESRAVHVYPYKAVMNWVRARRQRSGV